jgi:FAD/FMN-containing dehydrogenase
MADSKRAYRPWGRLSAPAQRVLKVPPDGMTAFPDGTVLPFGHGRSYGDVCLNSAGTILDTRAMSSILAFDRSTGIIRCQAGALLSDILDFAVPAGWFLPVTPGTRFVTVGGAIANDVHGKNHHRAGTFGMHVLRLELLRSDGSRITCSADENVDWFRATVGGLGLTGLILWSDVQLIPVAGRAIDADTTRFGNLSDFFALSEEADRKYEYTVSWIDCLAARQALGRGWFIGGNHAREAGAPVRRRRPINLFLEPPISMVNALSLRAFNLLYYNRPTPAAGPVDYEPFFYPLDSILNWNRMYGPRGFYQFQCVVPTAVGEAVIRELLVQTARFRQGSFLAVLKQFGHVISPGLLSFPRPGPTLALDFPNRGGRTRELLARLESIVMEAGGALYPAKDACMSADTFRRSYPEWESLEAMRDPAFSSDFWRRVTDGSAGGSAAAGGLQRRSSRPGT